MARLSREACSVWAKSNGPMEWNSLPQHMRDSADVAELLYRHWLSEQVKRRWSDAGFGSGVMAPLARFLAMAHDVGKAAPAFIAQLETFAERARQAGLPCPPMKQIKDDRKHLPHSLISEATMRGWLAHKGVSRSAAEKLASVVGAHHGRPVNSDQLKEARRRPLAMGGPQWERVRTELLDWAAEETGFDALLKTSPNLNLPLPVLVELTGFVIVADWIASNTRYFPLRPWEQDGVVMEASHGRIETAWDELGMPPAWQPGEINDDAESFFRRRFGWRPRAVQKAAFELAKSLDLGFVCVETVTGGGKTELAFAVAEVLAGRYGSQGVLVALPTQATTNAMFHRVTAWIDSLPQPPLEVAAWALTLGHGKSMLNNEYAEMVEAFAAFEWEHPDLRSLAAMYEDHPEDSASHEPDSELCSAVVHQWFLGSKRRLLANFAVVTIDQLLMAALQRKHLMLAHIALSGKVVIIDEAHASDEFMNVYLDSILNWLGAYRVPVIVLSATLTIERRKAMMNAYAATRRAEIDALQFDPRQYPLLTAIPRDMAEPVRVLPVEESELSRKVTWSWHSTDLEAVVDTVANLVEPGACVLVVRNTVADAQRTAAELEARGLPVILNHASFLAADHALNDAELLRLFGKHDDGMRPTRMVVVATQVVEQSLDIDFDVLLTDLAPMDLLLQRIGRLHRHRRIRPSHCALPHVRILADVDDRTLPTATSGSEAVYGTYLLLKTAGVLVSHGESIEIPGDVSPLVQGALGTVDQIPEAWCEVVNKARASWEDKLEKQRIKAATWALRPWAGGDDPRRTMGQWLPLANDQKELQAGAAVRDTEPTLEVIVVPLTPDGAAAIRPPWMTDPAQPLETLDTSTMPSDELAREIASWSIRLPTRMTRYCLDQVIEAIASDHTTKRWMWRRHPLLKGELLLPMTQLAEGGYTLSTQIKVNVKGRVIQYALRYSPTQGLEVTTP